MTELAALFPPPQKVRRAGGRVRAGEPSVTIDPGLASDGFVLHCDPRGVHIRAGSGSGSRYALAVVERLIDSDGFVPACEIEDWPDFSLRGVTIDVSRDKVPTISTLVDLIDRLDGWRYNHVELYVEHSFAYAGHEEVWRDASPYSVEDVRALDAHCRSLGIEFVVQQNCLGHMERWLAHPRYATLAATPGGYSDDRGNHEPAATLDPTSDEAFALVADLLDQLMTALPRSTRVHVGLDEPLDLNPELWARIFAERALDGVDDGLVVELPVDRQRQYTDWLRRLRALPSVAGREMLIWADVASGNPAVRRAIPTGVTLVEWGYEPGHPWDERCATFSAEGQPFMVCAGTSSWSALAGRPDLARTNLEEAAIAGLRYGASGYLVADWGDGGHHQFPVAAEAAWALGAAYAWNGNRASRLDWDRLVSAEVLDEDGCVGGSLVLALGRRSDLVVGRSARACLLTAMLGGATVIEALVAEGVTAESLEALEFLLIRDRETLDDVRIRRRDGELVCAELVQTIDWFIHACQRTLHVLGVARPGLQEDFERLIAEQRRLWLVRNRPGGLADSLSKIPAPQRETA